jgi:hypothetical protein
MGSPEFAAAAAGSGKTAAMSGTPGFKKITSEDARANLKILGNKGVYRPEGTGSGSDCNGDDPWGPIKSERTNAQSWLHSPAIIGDLDLSWPCSRNPNRSRAKRS